VLKDDGLFLLGDIRLAGFFKKFEKDIRNYFDIVVEENITSRIT
jgi:hypothetical protein